MPSTDKENMTADIGAIGGATKRAAFGERSSKKSRSKSIGPGGLDALKDGTGNRRKSIAAPPPRSILKPTMPPREIPIQTEAFKQTPHSPGAAKNPSTPTDFQATTKALVFGMAALPNPFASETNAVIAETRVLLRTEEEQQAAVREREAKGNLEMEDDNKRSEARRKSLANRRVSFAPEATLHTWDVVEYLQDSTTSSESTNSTRWASSTSARTLDSPQLESQSPPSTGTAKQQNMSSEQIEGPSTHQHDSIQKRRRRSSTIPPMNFNNPHDEFFTSSPSSDGSTAGDENDNQVLSNGDSDDISDSNSNSDDEGTAMSLDTGDNTDMSVKSNTSSNGSSARLDEALKEATQRAEIQRAGINGIMGLGIAEKGEVSSEQPRSKASSIQSLISSNDQENLNSYSPAFKSVIQHDDGMSVQLTQVGGQKFSEDETAMEMTAAIGGIISAPQTNSNKRRRKSGITVGRRNLRRRTSVASLGDDTMDLTAVIGGIQQTVNEVNATEDGQNEDMTMELTSVIGGVLASNSAPASKYKTPSTTRSQPLENRKRQSAISIIGDDAMDMTLAIGGILTEDVPSTASDDNTTIGMAGGMRTEDVPSTASDDNTTICMEMTTALGAILPKQPSTGKRKTRYGMDEQANRDSPLQATPSSSQGRVQANTITSETGSPSLASKGKGLRRSVGPRSSTTPKSMKTADTEAPTTKPLTPVKQFTPKLSRPASPKIKFPNTVKQGTASSESLFKDSAKIESSKSTPNKLFQRDITTGIATPSIILTPQKRSPGLSFDRAKLGSPRFTDLLDRRRSLSDISPVFTFGEIGEVKHGVRFDDPQVIEQELDKERQAEMDREDGRKIMEWEADTAETEKDATLNLKEMIESLTPKKRPLKGRKSLHVGTAKGILGKRPVELDEDDEETDEDLDGVRRLKNHQGSPVKSVKLQAPPSKAETTRRITWASRRSLETVSGNLITPTTTTPPLDGSMATTPKGQRRFKIVDSLSNPQQFIQNTPIDDPIPNEEVEEAERMHLQDFLNLTSIRFMELTTTKRRHTVAPNGMQKDVSSKHNSDAADQSFESCIVAGACTVPMLELYQHSCRELKKYISEGRSIVREIEKETLEENPPLFREYISAAPDVRVLMDNQFKNVKTHARLLSKAMWYEWRMKLLDGLKIGLHKISQGMDADDKILRHQQELLESILPPLAAKHGKLTEMESNLRSVAEELASCDQEELSEARQRLTSVETAIEVKKRMIHELQEQLREKETIFAAALERKQSYLDDIQEAEKIREACKGWSANEVLAIKARVDNLEKRYGWTITGASGNQLSMTYRREIELVFDATSFKSGRAAPGLEGQANSTVDLWYIAGSRELNPLPLTTEKEFFLQNIRDHCRSLPQGQSSVNALLKAVSASWMTTLEIMNDIRSLNHRCPTEITKTSDTSIVVRSSLLLRPLATKVMLEFHIHLDGSQNSLKVEVKPQCKVTYGERFNEAKIGEFLLTRITENEDKKSWGDIVAELEARLLARGRK